LDESAHARSDIVTKLKPLSNNAIQVRIDAVEKQLFSIDCTTYSYRTISEVLVNRKGTVGRPKLIINLTQIEYLRTWRFTWTRIAYTLCVSRTTLWRRLKEVNYNFQENRFTCISDSDLEIQVKDIKAGFEFRGERIVVGRKGRKRIKVVFMLHQATKRIKVVFMLHQGRKRIKVVFINKCITVV